MTTTDTECIASSLTSTTELADQSIMKHQAVSVTMTATKVKAKCPELLDRLAKRELGRVLVTRRGKVAAVMSPPETSPPSLEAMFGTLKGTVTIPDGADLTEPAFDGVMDAELGILHR